MLYVVLGHRIANAPATATGGRGSMSGIDQLGAAMLMAAVVATPFGLRRRRRRRSPIPPGCCWGSASASARR